MSLDRVDYRILSLLREDSRKPLKELAQAAGVSIPTARSRIFRLKKSGIIRRLTADVDLRPVTNCVTAFMTLNTRLADIKAVVEKLRDIDEVSEAYVTTGQHDVILKIYAPNMEALDLLVTERFSRIEGIEVAKSSFVIETAKDTVGPILRPGFGFRIKCDTCKGEIDCCVGLTKVFHGQERFFCGEQCLATFGRKS